MCIKTVITLSDIQPSVYFFLLYKGIIIITIEEIWKCLTLTRASTEFIEQELQIVITNDALMISDNNILMITSGYCCIFFHA